MNPAIADAQLSSGSRFAGSGLADKATLGLSVEVVDSLSGYKVPGILEGFTTGEVTIRVGELLLEGREVSVQVQHFSFFGEVVYCQVKDGHYEAHITIKDLDDKGLRREPRLAVRIPACLYAPHSETIPITLVNISGQGLRIEAPVSLRVQDPVVIRTEHAFVFGTVRYSRPAAEGGFRAGIEMQHALGLAEQETGIEPSTHGAGVFERLISAVTRRETGDRRKSHFWLEK